MRFDSAKALRAAGFQGFVATSALRTRLELIPTDPGVYVILGERRGRPRLLSKSPAGRWKGKNPTLPGAELQGAWVATSPILYVGKASTSLKARLRTYLRHGAGHSAGHWGGRAIWQLANSGALIVAWRVERRKAPRAVEREMIAEFVERFGKRPFANRTG